MNWELISALCLVAGYVLGYLHSLLANLDAIRNYKRKP